MELMHNEVIRIAVGDLKGLYRVVLDERGIERVISVRLDKEDKEDAGARPKVGRKKKKETKRPRKKAPPPLVGELIWLPRRELESLDRDHHLLHVEVDLDPIFYLPISAAGDKEIFESRKSLMKDFLYFANLRDSILVHAGLGGLVDAIVESATMAS